MSPSADTVCLAGIVEDSITDGPGLRFTVFTQGCPHNCPGCHNPQTHPFDGGTRYAVSELTDKIKNNVLCTGVTFSGGEPFCRASELLPLAHAVKAMVKELAIYSGYTYEEILSLGGDAFALLRLADTLVDGAYVEALRDYTLKFRGSSNQRVIDVQASLKEGKIVPDQSERWVP